jgi:MoaA/NifB/PqqE/SkfB family radical SAM enzyme
MALCVLVKAKQPRIEWRIASRSRTDILKYIKKVEYVGREIRDRRIYKRPGRWCSWCDYLPVCLGDYKAVEEILVRV